MLEAPAAPEIQTQRDPELQFCTEIGHGKTKQVHWACTTRGGTQSQEMSFCLLGKEGLGSHFFASESPGDCYISLSSTNVSSLSYSNKILIQIFLVACSRMSSSKLKIAHTATQPCNCA